VAVAASCRPAAARRRQAKAEVDEQPTGSVPGGLGDAMAARVALATRPCLGALTKLGDVLPTQRFKLRRVLVHGLLLS
jgi:hypothetical protein